jgi:hypothetical protein
MTGRYGLFAGLILALFLVAGPAPAAEPATGNTAVPDETIAPGTPLTFVVPVPGNATQVQEWTLACYKVTGVMSVPASCGAEVMVKNVTANPLVLDLPTSEQGTYTVIAAFPGPDGTFGIGYDRPSRTLSYAANHTVIANWSQKNPSDKEAAAVITKALASPGIENPSSTKSYTVAASAKAEANVTTPAATSPILTTGTGVPETTSATPAKTTAAPGFGTLLALAGLTAAALVLCGTRR